jgi:hypothetical protein
MNWCTGETLKIVAAYLLKADIVLTGVTTSSDSNAVVVK